MVTYQLVSCGVKENSSMITQVISVRNLLNTLRHTSREFSLTSMSTSSYTITLKQNQSQSTIYGT